MNNYLFGLLCVLSFSLNAQLKFSSNTKSVVEQNMKKDARSDSFYLPKRKAAYLKFKISCDSVNANIELNERFDLIKNAVNNHLNYVKIQKKLKSNFHLEDTSNNNRFKKILSLTASEYFSALKVNEEYTKYENCLKVFNWYDLVFKTELEPYQEFRTMYNAYMKEVWWGKSSIDYDDFISQINQIRVKGCKCGNNYLPPSQILNRNKLLFYAASQHNRDLYFNQFLSHTGKDKTEPFDRTLKEGFYGHRVEEIIYWNRYKGTIDEAISAIVQNESACLKLMKSNYNQIGLSKIMEYWTIVIAEGNNQTSSVIE